ncbi:FMN-binding glutamate synthase family protein [Facilibium subflavum]|uniref:FMN-binding glutamate synthase family protein n=1 Tax=Facilibium subflavum TaxID=2219058 RepID=UPI000E65A32D|nr:FMN-binding glutamate synthase family protein [Facilibium subflavum]
MFKISERRKWYIGFGICFLIILALLSLLHSYITISIFLGIILLVAVYDLLQKKHTILRNFPVLGHMRFILEFFRPEIQQYFVASNESERPFDRQTRTLVYQRAKGINDTLPFGTERNITYPGYEWALHSLSPAHPDDVDPRIQVGNKQCRQPYQSSRLNISAMSYGALSKHAIIALNKGAKMGNFCHNTGEGGLSEYHLQGGDLTLQIGTGYFGFRTPDGDFDPDKFARKANLEVVKMIEIKLSQGAKPAHGGVLPKSKLTPEIARIRDVPMDKDVLSPPSHSSFSTPEGLCHFIAQVRDLSNGKPVGFKLCLGRRTEFLSICKAMLKTGIYPDFITIDGAEGGTGAAPEEYVNHLGVPLEDAIAFVHNALVGCNIREHIRLIASGKTATGFDMVKRISLGADIINSARAMMLSLGCIQSKQCDRNTCPTGVATQNPRLYRALDVNDKAKRVYNFHKATMKSFSELVGAIGLKDPSDLSASRIMRRIDEQTVKSLDEVYQYIKPGCLIDGENIPEKYLKYWHQASAEKFS